MTDPYKLFIRKQHQDDRCFSDDPESIIPEGSPLYFKWGYPALITILRYKKLDKISKSTIDDEDKSFLNAAENLEAAKFSCIYGKPLGKPLRKITKSIEENNITSRKNLRSLVYSRFFLETKNNESDIRRSKLLFFGDLYITVASIFLLLIFTSTMYYSPIHTILSLGLFAIISIFLIFSIFFQYHYGIKPFFISKKIIHDFNRIKNKHTHKNKLKLVTSD